MLSCGSSYLSSFELVHWTSRICGVMSFIHSWSAFLHVICLLIWVFGCKTLFLILKYFTLCSRSFKHQGAEKEEIFRLKDIFFLFFFKLQLIVRCLLFSPADSLSVSLWISKLIRFVWYTLQSFSEGL